MINTEIRLIIFFAAKEGEALYSQQKQVKTSKNKSQVSLLRNLYAGQEATVRTGHGTTDWFQIGKGVCQGCILSACYLTYMQSTS